MKCTRTLAMLVVALTGLLISTITFAGPDGLLGLSIDDSGITFNDFDFGGEQGVTYDSSTNILTGTATATVVTFPGGQEEGIVGGTVTLTLEIDELGNVVGPGSLVVTGNSADPDTMPLASPLLVATVNDYGILDNQAPASCASGTDLMDFALTVTGGSLKPFVDAVNSEASLVAGLESSTYCGSFESDWSSDGFKGDVGPQPMIVMLPPHTIGFWKNHPEDWPTQNLVICGQNLDQDQLIDILSTPVRGDKSISMTHQLIATKLNVLAGNACDAGTLSDAEQWLLSHGCAGSGVRKWDGGEPIKNTLDDFNNGNGNCEY